jgi:hypothetical protein
MRINRRILVRDMAQLGLFIHDIQHIAVNVDLFQPARVERPDGVKMLFGHFEIAHVIKGYGALGAQVHGRGKDEQEVFDHGHYAFGGSVEIEHDGNGT